MWGSLRLSPIISNTHAPLLQLCIVTPNHIMIAMPLMVTITLYGATIQGCSGAWVLLITILAIVSCTGLYLSFYTCLTISFLYFLHLFNSVLSNVFLGGGAGGGENYTMFIYQCKLIMSTISNLFHIIANSAIRWHHPIYFLYISWLKTATSTVHSFTWKFYLFLNLILNLALALDKCI